MGWGGYPPELAWWTGGRPRALIPGDGVREGLAWQAKAEHPATELARWTGGQGGGARARGGGARASVPGGVGGRGTGPRDGAKRVSYFCCF